MKRLGSALKLAVATVIVYVALVGVPTAAQQTVDIFNITQVATKYLTVRLTDGTNYLGGAATAPVAVRITNDGSTFASATDASHGSNVFATGPQGMLEAAINYVLNTAVSDGQAVRWIADKLGRGVTIQGCDPGARVSSVTTVTDGSSTSAIAAGGSGITTEIWFIAVANTSATPVTLDIRDGTAGTVLATFPVPANVAGFIAPLPVPLTGSANTAVAVDPSASATSIITTLIGCKGK